MMNTGALARFLHDAGIVDYRPTTTGGDCFIDFVPADPDALVAVVSLGGDVDPTTGETIAEFQVRVRGERNDPTGPAARAQNITAAIGVLADATPVVIAAGTPDEVTALLVSASAPSNAGLDELSRSEWIVRVSIRSTPVVVGLPDTALLETKAGAQAKADAAQAAAVTVFAGHAAATTNVHGIADTSLLETQAGAQAKADAAQTAAEATASGDATAQIAAHNDDTTDVHGIPDTSLLETQAGAQAKADAAQSAAEATAAADATAQVDGHNTETLGVHGIPDTSTLETQAGAQVKATAAQTAAEATAAATYVPLTQKGSPEGVATLDTGGKVPTSQLPPLAITESHVVADETAMLALDAQTGDIAIRTDNSKSFILSATPASNIANWNELLTPPNEVVSVDGRVGAVSLTDLYTPAAHADDTTGVHGIADTARLVRDNAAVDFNNGDAGAVPVTITTADGQSASAFLVRRANGTSLLTLASTGYLSAVDVQASGGLRIGTSVTYSTGDRLLSIENSPDIPTGTPTNGVIVYADNGRLLVRDDRGAGWVATEAYADAAAAAAQAAAEGTASAVYIPATEKAQADGVATLDATGVVPEAQLPPLDYVPNAEKGAPDGVATLDANGVVPDSQLPPPAGFLGDWQAGEYQPGQLLASNGFLMTPRVVTSNQPVTGESFPELFNTTGTGWTVVLGPGGSLSTTTNPPYVNVVNNALNKGSIYANSVLADWREADISLGIYYANTNSASTFSIGFQPESHPTTAQLFTDTITDGVYLQVNSVSPNSANTNIRLYTKVNGVTTLSTSSLPIPAMSSTTLASLRLKFGEVAVDQVYLDVWHNNEYFGRLFVPGAPNLGPVRLAIGARVGSSSAQNRIWSVTASNEVLSPDWRRLATLVDES